MTRVTILTDPVPHSYRVIGRLFRRTFEAAGLGVVERPMPTGEAERQRAADEAEGTVVFHNTIGPRFAPLPGAVNVALPNHEWSRYPARWCEQLNRFDAVWTTTTFVRRVLRASGVTAPIVLVRPALDLDPPVRKRSWQASVPFRFLTCGDAHFRKGFHLLVAGFLEAFPHVGEATLTIKTSADCRWQSPRRDIVLKTAHLPRHRLLGLYRDFDAYVTTSLGEGLGLPVAEAVLAGLPVVAHRWSGHADLLMPSGCFELPCQVVFQPFASQPSYYAVGQRCAFTHPSAIAGGLRQAVESSPGARRTLARVALRHLSKAFGSQSAVHRLQAAWRRLPVR
jgi:glycosyltransferase involved in cell wall biosynthesis